MATPREILDERLAKGEITIDEHTQLTNAITSSSSKSGEPQAPQSLASSAPPSGEAWMGITGKAIKTAFILLVLIAMIKSNPSAASFDQHIETVFAQLASSGEAAKHSNKSFGHAVFGFLCTAAPVECGRQMKNRFTISTQNFLFFSLGHLRNNAAPYEHIQCFGFTDKWHCPE